VYTQQGSLPGCEKVYMARYASQGVLWWIYSPVCLPGCTMVGIHPPYHASLLCSPRYTLHIRQSCISACTRMGSGGCLATKPWAQTLRYLGNEAHSAPSSPKGVREEGPLCALSLRLSRKKGMNDRIDGGSFPYISLCNRDVAQGGPLFRPSDCCGIVAGRGLFVRHGMLRK